MAQPHEDIKTNAELRATHADDQTALSPPPGFIFPAEWEEHECVWLSWPEIPEESDDPTWSETYSIRSSMVNFTAALVPFVPVRMMVMSSNLTQAKKWLQKVIEGPHAHNFSFFVKDTTPGDVWIRDWGPIFIRDKKSGSVQMVAFKWPYWGYIDYTLPSYKVDLEPYTNAPYQIADDLGVKVYPYYTIASEGGDREFNGYGSVILCEAVELNRNPNRTKKEIEDAFRATLGVTNFIWMKEGVVDDSHPFNGKINSAVGPVLPCACTGGHVDEFVRWVDRYTVILADVFESERTDPIGAENFKRMSINYQILKNSTAEDGTPLRILRIYLPPPIYVDILPGNPQHLFYQTLRYTDGTIIGPDTPVKAILAASYLNFFVTNGAVLVPQYYRPGRNPLTELTDAYAMHTLSVAFPNRKIVGVYVDGLNINGGGMHCASQQQPAKLNSHSQDT